MWLPYAVAIFMASVSVTAEIIDRIAVSIGNSVITESELIEEIRVTAFLNHSEPLLTSEEKHNAAERLIKQRLFKRDMGLSHYPMPAIEEGTKVAAAMRTPDPAGFDSDLERCGITEEILAKHLWWQITLLQFLDYRFRSAIQLQEADIADRYQKMKEDWEKKGETSIPTIEEARASIEKLLTDERVDQAADRWLGDARTQMDIRFHKEAFE